MINIFRNWILPIGTTILLVVVIIDFVKNWFGDK